MLNRSVLQSALSTDVSYAARNTTDVSRSGLCPLVLKQQMSLFSSYLQYLEHHTEFQIVCGMVACVSLGYHSRKVTFPHIMLYLKHHTEFSMSGEDGRFSHWVSVADGSHFPEKCCIYGILLNFHSLMPFPNQLSVVHMVISSTI